MRKQGLLVILVVLKMFQGGGHHETIRLTYNSLTHTTIEESLPPLHPSALHKEHNHVTFILRLCYDAFRTRWS
jgi:hypothetical protein